jgi:excisionase family DNA binding protein
LDRTETEETYLTVAEVAEMLKLNQQTVRNWIDQGSLPALRVGRRVRIKRSDFDRILEESYSGRPTPSGADAGSGEALGGPSAGAGTGAGGAEAGSEGGRTPSAEDFWGGEPVGIPEPVLGESGHAGNGHSS